MSAAARRETLSASGGSDPWMAPASALSLLARTDAQRAANRLLELKNQPKRLLLWGLFALFFLFTVVTRTLGPHSPGQNPIGGIGHVLGPGLAGSALVPGLFLGLLGWSIATAARSVPLTFCCSAEGQLLSLSRVPTGAIAMWGLLRKTLTRGFSLLPASFFVWNGFIGQDAGQWLPLAATVVAGYVAIMLVRAPVPLLGRMFPRLPLAKVGYALSLLGASAAAVAAAPLAGSAVPKSLSAAASALAQVPPGDVLVAAAAGHLWALLPLVVVPLLWAAPFAWSKPDLVPELWDATVQREARLSDIRASGRRGLVGALIRSGDQTRSPSRPRGASSLSRQGVRPRQRLRRPGTGSEEAREGASARLDTAAPPGAWAVGWLKWMELRRSTTVLRLAAAGVVLPVVLGALTGVLVQRYVPHPAVVVPAVGSEMLLLRTVFQIQRLGGELGQPLWWLSADTLRARLSVLNAANTVAWTVPLVLALAGAAAATSTGQVLVWAPLLAAVLWLFRGSSLATYSLMPSSVDLRGPGSVLRILANLLAAVPPAIVTIALAASANALLGSLVGAVVCIAEGWGFVAFAAARLDGDGLRYFREERG